MSLKMKSRCEKCDRELSMDAHDAFICSYECTFCTVCADGMKRICPNCTGNLQPRPARPVKAFIPNTAEALAVKLKSLHQKGNPVTIVNAWDPVSAVLAQAAGATAIGTSSAAVAHSLGYPDGEQIPIDELIAAIRRITRVVPSLPVTADVERGYAATTDDLEIFLTRCIEDAGAVGINLEDSLPSDPLIRDAEEQALRIKTARAVGVKLGVPLVINARVDLYLANVGAPELRVAETIRRSRIYLEAGADCIFVPMLSDEETIATLVKEIDAPVNILVLPTTPGRARLAEMGVARISLGAGPFRSAMGRLNQSYRAALAGEDWKAMIEGGIPFKEMDDMMKEVVATIGGK